MQCASENDQGACKAASPAAVGHIGEQQEQTKSEVPQDSTVRTGEHKILHPTEVVLHSSDFSADDALKAFHAKYSSEARWKSTVMSQYNARAVPRSARRSSGCFVQESCKEEAWEQHYQTHRTQFFPIKNYILRAFPSLLKALGYVDTPEHTLTGTQREVGGGTEHPHGKRGREEGDQASDGGARGAGEEHRRDRRGDTSKGEEVSCEPKVIMECGCGTGSALFGIMRHQPQHTFIGFDISRTAVDLLVNHAVAVEHRRIRQQAGEPCGQHFFQMDISMPDSVASAQAAKLAELPKADFVLLIFVLSALDRPGMIRALTQLRQSMKQGGLMCFRDYSVGDHNHGRFIDHGNMLVYSQQEDEERAKHLGIDLPDVGQGFWKADGTRQYFFSVPECVAVFRSCGFHFVEGGYHCNKVVNRKTGQSMQKMFVNITLEAGVVVDEPKVEEADEK